MLVLLGGLLMPVLIWVALGAALTQKARERRAGQRPSPTIGEILTAAGLTLQEDGVEIDHAVAARTFTRRTASELDGILARAGLSLHEETAPRHCWDVLSCDEERRQRCPAFARRDVPGWIAVALGDKRRLHGVCVDRTLVDIPGLPLKT